WLTGSPSRAAPGWWGGTSSRRSPRRGASRWCWRG
ncbi:MAG: hypothetical protein AVDCRST_MAG54-3148, partial [uncultured Actinomycetospora sp.]